MLNISDDIEHLDKNIIKLLSVLLSDTILARKKINILEDEFDLQMREVIEGEGDNMCTLGEALVEKWYEKGRIAGEERGEQRGISIGEQRGISIGEQRGKTLAKLDLIKTWIQEDGLSLEQAFKLGRVAEAEQPEYRAQLNF